MNDRCLESHYLLILGLFPPNIPRSDATPVPSFCKESLHQFVFQMLMLMASSDLGQTCDAIEKK